MVKDKEIKVISEVYTILNQMDESDISKIPKKLLDELEKRATLKVDYIYPDVSLENLKIEEETKTFLAVIMYNYFCSKEEQEQWFKEFQENEKKYQKELNEKFKYDNLFENKKSDSEYTKQENKEIIVYKESFIKKIMNYLKNKFKNKKY